MPPLRWASAAAAAAVHISDEFSNVAHGASVASLMWATQWSTTTTTTNNSTATASPPPLHVSGDGWAASVKSLDAVASGGMQVGGASILSVAVSGASAAHYREGAVVTTTSDSGTDAAAAPSQDGSGAVLVSPLVDVQLIFPQGSDASLTPSAKVVVSIPIGGVPPSENSTCSAAQLMQPPNPNASCVAGCCIDGRCVCRFGFVGERCQMQVRDRSIELGS
jgi:hypothetical protein